MLRMTLSVGLDVNDDLTVADLLDFADLVRMCGARREACLEQITAPQDETTLVRFEVTGVRLGSAGTSLPVQLQEEERQEFLEALEVVIDSEGDARGVLQTLKELRSRLTAANPFIV